MLFVAGLIGAFVGSTVTLIVMCFCAACKDDHNND